MIVEQIKETVEIELKLPWTAPSITSLDADNTAGKSVSAGNETTFNISGPS